MADSIFLRLLDSEDKASALFATIDAIADGRVPADVFTVDPTEFSAVPGSPFCYNVSSQVRELFENLPAMQSNDVHICEGLNTTDNERFLRLAWEVNPTSIGLKRRWVPLAKGGEYAQFYSDLHLLVEWENNGERLKRIVRETYGSETKRIYGQSFYFMSGITYSQRTQKGLSFRCLPQNSIFNVKGPGIFAPVDLYPTLLAILNSLPFKALVELQTAFGSYNVGYLQRTPVPFNALSHKVRKRLGYLSIECVNAKRRMDSTNETSHVFCFPAIMTVPNGSLSERITKLQLASVEVQRMLDEYQREIDNIAFELYGINDKDRISIEESLGWQAGANENDRTSNNRDNDTEEADTESTADANRLIVDQVSYCVSCAFGRWDVRYATGELPAPELPDPFAPLPVCAPGALTGEDGLPLHEAPEGYPLRVDWDGILVDDPDHEDDIIRRIRDVFELLWQERAEAIEHEACALLGVKTLRDFFRKPGNDGFWMQHVKRYSKSRRKAPIYWLLQSSKKNYALWLYYHRLDKDILFKALVNYVEPKLRLEETGLEQLRSQRAAGVTGREARQLDRQIEKQEALLSELHDFHDRVRRAAELRLEPDLNDGVVLNIAPLWELVPWTEAKKYWHELLAGKYEWSSIGKQLRDRKLVKA